MKSMPCDLDILLGRKKEAITHPGNQRLKHLVNLHLDTYTSISRSAKTRMVFGIVEGIQEAGGTFLKFDDEANAWKAIDDKGAREKVGHSFRDCLSVRKAKERKASGDSAGKTTTAKKRKSPKSRKRKATTSSPVTSPPAVVTSSPVLPSSEEHQATTSASRFPRRVSDTDTTIQEGILGRIEESLDDEEASRDQEPLPFQSNMEQSRGSSSWILKSMEELEFFPDTAESLPPGAVGGASAADHIMIGADIPQDIFDDQQDDMEDSFNESATSDAWVVETKENGAQSQDILGDVVGV
mmetsp:Transcript_29228/g.43075  ORF Transcript_29228/g.43075 Transcript_29228/m.43075 type:complete len:297 (-) Transcript_29228:3861-4751(-)